MWVSLFPERSAKTSTARQAAAGEVQLHDREFTISLEVNSLSSFNELLRDGCLFLWILIFLMTC